MSESHSEGPVPGTALEAPASTHLGQQMSHNGGVEPGMGAVAATPSTPKCSNCAKLLRHCLLIKKSLLDGNILRQMHEQATAEIAELRTSLQAQKRDVMRAECRVSELEGVEGQLLEKCEECRMLLQNKHKLENDIRAHEFSIRELQSRLSDSVSCAEMEQLRNCLKRAEKNAEKWERQLETLKEQSSQAKIASRKVLQQKEASLKEERKLRSEADRKVTSLNAEISRLQETIHDLQSTEAQHAAKIAELQKEGSSFRSRERDRLLGLELRQLQEDLEERGGQVEMLERQLASQRVVYEEQIAELRSVLAVRGASEVPATDDRLQDLQTSVFSAIETWYRRQGDLLSVPETQSPPVGIQQRPRRRVRSPSSPPPMSTPVQPSNSQLFQVPEIPPSGSLSKRRKGGRQGSSDEESLSPPTKRVHVGSILQSLRRNIPPTLSPLGPHPEVNPPAVAGGQLSTQEPPSSPPPRAPALSLGRSVVMVPRRRRSSSTRVTLGASTTTVTTCTGPRSPPSPAVHTVRDPPAASKSDCRDEDSLSASSEEALVADGDDSAGLQLEAASMEVDTPMVVEERGHGRPTSRAANRVWKSPEREAAADVQVNGRTEEEVEDSSSCSSDSSLSSLDMDTSVLGTEEEEEKERNKDVAFESITSPPPTASPMDPASPIALPSGDGMPFLTSQKLPGIARRKLMQQQTQLQSASLVHGAHVSRVENGGVESEVRGRKQDAGKEKKQQQQEEEAGSVLDSGPSAVTSLMDVDAETLLRQSTQRISQSGVASSSSSSQTHGSRSGVSRGESSTASTSTGLSTDQRGNLVLAPLAGENFDAYINRMIHFILDHQSPATDAGHLWRSLTNFPTKISKKYLSRCVDCIQHCFLEQNKPEEDGSRLTLSQASVERLAAGLHHIASRSTNQLLLSLPSLVLTTVRQAILATEQAPEECSSPRMFWQSALFVLLCRTRLEYSRISTLLLDALQLQPAFPLSLLEAIAFMCPSILKPTTLLARSVMLGCIWRLLHHAEENLEEESSRIHDCLAHAYRLCQWTAFPRAHNALQRLESLLQDEILPLVVSEGGALEVGDTTFNALVSLQVISRCCGWRFSFNVIVEGLWDVVSQQLHVAATRGVGMLSPRRAPKEHACQVQRLLLNVLSRGMDGSGCGDKKAVVCAAMESVLDVCGHQAQELVVDAEGESAVVDSEGSHVKLGTQLTQAMQQGVHLIRSGQVVHASVLKIFEEWCRHASARCCAQNSTSPSSPAAGTEDGVHT